MGVGVCCRPERRDTSCSDAAVVVVDDPSLVGVAEGVDAGVDVGVVVGVVDDEDVSTVTVPTGIIEVGDVELLRDVLPFRVLKI